MKKHHLSRTESASLGCVIELFVFELLIVDYTGVGGSSAFSSEHFVYIHD